MRALRQAQRGTESGSPVGAGDGFPPARERRFDCAQGRLSGKDSVRAELVAGYVADELHGGLHPVVGPEAPDYAVHDVQQEADDGLALVGALADDAGDAGVVCEGWRREGRGQVFEGLVLPRCVGAAGVRGWVPACAGTTIRLPGTTGGALAAPLGVALDASQPGYGFGHELGGDCLDLHSGVSPVACLEAFVIELAVGDVEVELDDCVPVVGLVADDVRERSWPSLFVGITHMFYYEG